MSVDAYIYGFVAIIIIVLIIRYLYIEPYHFSSSLLFEVKQALTRTILSCSELP